MFYSAKKCRTRLCTVPVTQTWPHDVCPLSVATSVQTRCQRQCWRRRSFFRCCFRFARSLRSSGSTLRPVDKWCDKLVTTFHIWDVKRLGPICERITRIRTCMLERVSVCFFWPTQGVILITKSMDLGIVDGGWGTFYTPNVAPIYSNNRYITVLFLYYIYVTQWCSCLCEQSCIFPFLFCAVYSRDAVGKLLVLPMPSRGLAKCKIICSIRWRKLDEKKEWVSSAKSHGLRSTCSL